MSKLDKAKSVMMDYAVEETPHDDLVFTSDDRSTHRDPSSASSAREKLDGPAPRDFVAPQKLPALLVTRNGSPAVVTELRSKPLPRLVGYIFHQHNGHRGIYATWGLVIAGLGAPVVVKGRGSGTYDYDGEEIAKGAYRMADIMMKVRHT